MKVKMMIVALGVVLSLATQVYAQSNPCSAAGACTAATPCNTCDSCNPCDPCNSKPCDLFSGLKSLLRSQPSAVGCAPCAPVVSCGSCETVPPQACLPSAADPCGFAAPMANNGCGAEPCGPGPGACEPGCGLPSFGCGPNGPGCGPNFGLAAPCGPAFGGCDSGCGPSACGGCGFTSCCCPGPLENFFAKSRMGAKKFFKNLFGTLDCNGGCDPCGPSLGGCGCGSMGGCGDQGCGPVAAPAACDPCAQFGPGCGTGNGCENTPAPQACSFSSPGCK